MAASFSLCASTQIKVFTHTINSHGITNHRKAKTSLSLKNDGVTRSAVVRLATPSSKFPPNFFIVFAWMCCWLYEPHSKLSLKHSHFPFQNTMQRKCSPTHTADKRGECYTIVSRHFQLIGICLGIYLVGQI